MNVTSHCHAPVQILSTSKNQSGCKNLVKNCLKLYCGSHVDKQKNTHQLIFPKSKIENYPSHLTCLTTVYYIGQFPSTSLLADVHQYSLILSMSKDQSDCENLVKNCLNLYCSSHFGEQKNTHQPIFPKGK